MKDKELRRYRLKWVALVGKGVAEVEVEETILDVSLLYFCQVLAPMEAQEAGRYHLGPKWYDWVTSPTRLVVEYDKPTKE